MRRTLEAPATGRPTFPLLVWHTVRPFSLVVAVLPVLVGTAALVPEGTVRPAVAAGCLAVAVLLQAGTNAVNDAEDAATGADATPTAMPALALRRGWVTPGFSRAVGLACLAAAAVAGLALALAAGRPWLILLGAAGAAVGLAYAAPPLRLAYRPLGELASGVPMGLGITWGTAAAQAATVPRSVLWAAGPLAALTAAVLHANNARDRVHDAAIGKRTLATYLPPAGVVAEFRVLVLLAPGLVAAGLAARALPAACILALLPGVLAVRTAAAATTGTDARGWTRLLVGCVRLHGLFGISLATGLVLSRFL